MRWGEQPFSFAMRKKGSRRNGIRALTSYQMRDALRLYARSNSTTKTRRCLHRRFNKVKMKLGGTELFIYHSGNLKSRVLKIKQAEYGQRKDETVEWQSRGAQAFSHSPQISLLAHSTNKRNRNRIRRSILRRIHAATVSSEDDKGCKLESVRHLQALLEFFPPKAKQEACKPCPTSTERNRYPSSSPNQAQTKGCKIIRYPKAWSPDTPVCTRSKCKERR